MAKKRRESSEPVISNIPIPASDNPMVIDLPDGQKIVLGKLNPGSVIEVATWRGTGRPDSRTNRFMLGVSDSSNSAPPTSDSQASAPAKSKITLPWKREKARGSKTTAESSHFMSEFLVRIVSVFSKVLKRTSDLAPVESTTDLEINAWIENLSREVKEESKPAPRKAVAKKATVKKNSKKRSITSAKKMSK